MADIVSSGAQNALTGHDETWKNPPVRSSDINGIRGYALVQMAERLGY